MVYIIRELQKLQNLDNLGPRFAAQFPQNSRWGQHLGGCHIPRKQTIFSRRSPDRYQWTNSNLTSGCAHIGGIRSWWIYETVYMSLPYSCCHVRSAMNTFAAPHHFAALTPFEAALVWPIWSHPPGKGRNPGNPKQTSDRSELVMCLTICNMKSTMKNVTKPTWLC